MIVVRSDGDADMGTGHVMRMLALAQAYESQVVFVSMRMDSALKERVHSMGFEVVVGTAAPASAADVTQTAEHARRLGASWVLVDGYVFDAAYQRGLQSHGLRVLLVDDYGHAKTYSAELVVNTNAAADPALYDERSAQTELLLGPSYALLRSEFLEQTPRKEHADKARHLLITMGGADPVNASAWVLEALRVMQLGADTQVSLLVGPANQQGEELKHLAGERCTVITAPNNVAALMASADLVISAAGVTTYELAYLGVPMLLTVLADNQVAVAQAMDSAGAAESLGWHRQLAPDALAARVVALIEDQPRRERLSRTAAALVDGRGAQRTVQRMQSWPQQS